MFELPLDDDADAGDRVRANSYVVCDLTTGESQDVAVDTTRRTLDITADRRGAGYSYSSSYVLLVSVAPQAAAACEAVALDSSTWLPIDG